MLLPLLNVNKDRIAFVNRLTMYETKNKIA